VLKRIGDDRGQVQPVGGATPSAIGLQAGRSPVEETKRADAVSTSGVGEADTDLGKALPQVALNFGPSLPASLQDLVRCEWPAGFQQSSGRGHGLQWWEGLLRHLFDAGGPIGQRAPESVPRPPLSWATDSITIPSVGHR
jgi:hypothetical protein